MQQSCQAQETLGVKLPPSLVYFRTTRSLRIEHRAQFKKREK